MSIRSLLASAFLLAILGAAWAGDEPKIVEKRDGRYLRLSLKDDPKAQGWLYEVWDDAEGEAEKHAELIVALHGAGGDPRNFILPRLMTDRHAFCLAVAGRREVAHATGRGFMWSRDDVAYVLALTRHVIKTRRVDPRRVLVWGHSAGGVMTLDVLAQAPELFAGALTSAAGAAPGTPHAAKRVFVILGEDDPNYRIAPRVREHIERAEKAPGSCALLSVEWLEHVLPANDFLDLGFDWVMHGKGRGGEAKVGLVPKGRAGPWRHILIRHTEAKERDEDVERSKKDAVALLDDVRKAVTDGTAFFPFEAARLSEDTRSRSAGGGLSPRRVVSYFGEAPALEPGASPEVIASSFGLHLVLREIDEDGEEED